jgi:ligand-binding SRPBCC domain-containing protein
VREPIKLSFRSDLAAPRPEVWSVVSTMRGVNAELGPWVRMTHPRDADRLDAASVPATGDVLFRSWLLAFGVLPFDRHSLAIVSVDAGSGFVEESRSWLQQRWRHERRLTDRTGSGCTVVDELVIQPRIGLVTPITRRTVRAIFEHRHRRLRKRFGAIEFPGDEGDRDE